MAKYHPSYTTILADASSFGIGAVLLPMQPSGERQPVTFASRSMMTTEQRYSQTEKETLAVTWAIMRSFNEFVRGRNFAFQADNQRLVTLFSKMELDMLPPCVQRLCLKLIHYQFTMQYVPGKLLATVSRGYH